MRIETALLIVFGCEYEKLNNAERKAVHPDFMALAREEFDCGDPSIDWDVEMENMQEAANVYRRRIGRDNLKSYAACLMAGKAYRATHTN